MKMKEYRYRCTTCKKEKVEWHITDRHIRPKCTRHGEMELSEKLETIRRDT